MGVDRNPQRDYFWSLKVEGNLENKYNSSKKAHQLDKDLGRSSQNQRILAHNLVIHMFACMCCYGLPMCRQDISYIDLHQSHYSLNKSYHMEHILFQQMNFQLYMHSIPLMKARSNQRNFGHRGNIELCLNRNRIQLDSCCNY